MWDLSITTIKCTRTVYWTSEPYLSFEQNLTCQSWMFIILSLRWRIEPWCKSDLVQIIKHITALKEQIHAMQHMKLSPLLTIQVLQSSATVNNSQKLIKLRVSWNMASTKAPNKKPCKHINAEIFCSTNAII